jgi:hypothetical protein
MNHELTPILSRAPKCFGRVDTVGVSSSNLLEPTKIPSQEGLF